MSGGVAVSRPKTSDWFSCPAAEARDWLSCEFRAQFFCAQFFRVTGKCYQYKEGQMTDSPSQISDSSLVRITTLRRLALQLEKMEGARHRSLKYCKPAAPGPARSQELEPSPAKDLQGEHPPEEHPHAEHPPEVISTGIEALDRLLPDGGFREGTLIEWLADSGAADQLALLAARPALGEDRFLIVIDEEKTFYPPAAASLGIDLERLVLVRPGRSVKPVHDDRRSQMVVPVHDDRRRTTSHRSLFPSSLLTG